MSPSKAARLAILGLVATISSAFPLSALADGEAGLVIQDGENVRTYCLAFGGESISGDQLLHRLGLDQGSPTAAVIGAGQAHVTTSPCSGGGEHLPATARAAHQPGQQVAARRAASGDLAGLNEVEHLLALLRGDDRLPLAGGHDHPAVLP